MKKTDNSTNKKNLENRIDDNPDTTKDSPMISNNTSSESLDIKIRSIELEISKDLMKIDFLKEKIAFNEYLLEKYEDKKQEHEKRFIESINAWIEIDDILRSQKERRKEDPTSFMSMHEFRQECEKRNVNYEWLYEKLNPKYKEEIEYTRK